MWYNLNIKNILKTNMDTKEKSFNCCSNIDEKYKKVFMAVALLVLIMILSSIVIAVRGEFDRNNVSDGNYSKGKMMKREIDDLALPASVGDRDQFVLPQDAARSGEIAIMVNDFEIAKKNVADIAVEGGGNVYASFISYASSNAKNGSIMVQVPMEKFDTVFESLKNVGSIVQESTQQVETRNTYPRPMIAKGKTFDNQNLGSAEAATISTVNPEIAIYPNPIDVQFAQNRGYIRVVFVDYGGVAKGSAAMMQNRNAKENMLGVGNFSNRNMQDNLIVGIGLKLILLVVILGLCLVVFKRIIHQIKKQKEHKKAVHVVRQMPKTHRRIVKIASRK